MPNKPSDSKGGKLPDVFGEDLLTVNVDSRISEVQHIDSEAELESSGFELPTPDNLKHVVTGCYVLVRDKEALYWAEVLAINGETVVGRTHGELSKNKPASGPVPTRAVFFKFDQVKALGCDRYCSCE